MVNQPTTPFLPRSTSITAMAAEWQSILDFIGKGGFDDDVGEPACDRLFKLQEDIVMATAETVEDLKAKLSVWGYLLAEDGAEIADDTAAAWASLVQGVGMFTPSQMRAAA